MDPETRLAQRQPGVDHRYRYLKLPFGQIPGPIVAEWRRQLEARVGPGQPYRQCARRVGDAVPDRRHGARRDPHARLVRRPVIEVELATAGPVHRVVERWLFVRQGAVGHANPGHRHLLEAAVADHPDLEGLALARRAGHIEPHGVQPAAHPVLGELLRRDGLSDTKLLPWVSRIVPPLRSRNLNSSPSGSLSPFSTVQVKVSCCEPEPPV